MSVFFNINDAINSNIIDSKHIFIIANERTKKDGSIGRSYKMFKNYDFFLKHREKYQHCHEIFVDHTNNTPNIAGRLVFDFDIKYDDNIVIPKDFKKQIKMVILKIINSFYKNIDTDILVFVWSSCENNNKLSKHLTVKNIYFENWIPMIKIFYQLFSKMWDQEYKWILSDKLIDQQIIRKNASLRMVGSKKIGGNILKLHNQNAQSERFFLYFYHSKSVSS